MREYKNVGRKDEQFQWGDLIGAVSVVALPVALMFISQLFS